MRGDSLYFNRASQKYRDAWITNDHEIKGILSGGDNFPVVSCDDLRKIKMPVLLVKGNKSPAIFAMMIEEMNSCLTNREIGTLVNTTHGLEYENPAEFNKIVLGFIDRQ